MARPGISTKNAKKIPPGPKFWNPKKIPPKYRKNTPKIRIFGIFGVFFRYFRGILGVNSGSPEFRAGGYFFGIFRGNSGSGHSQRARRGILMPRGKICREAKIAARQFLPLNCRATTLTTGAILEKKKNVLYCGGEAIWEAC